MTKADLIDIVADRLRLPRGRAELLVGHIFDSDGRCAAAHEGIEIRGFGSFSIRTYREYEGRNPRTGEAVHVQPKRLAFFKVGKELRERVNNGRHGASPAGETGRRPGGDHTSGGPVTRTVSRTRVREQAALTRLRRLRVGRRQHRRVVVRDRPDALRDRPGDEHVIGSRPDEGRGLGGRRGQPGVDGGRRDDDRHAVVNLADDLVRLRGQDR